jgi:hypothetical protein
MSAEVVEGKDPRQVEQLDHVRQGHLRQVPQGSAVLEVDHAIRGL